MSEQLQKELAAWLGRLREAADAGGSFVLDQAPLIVQERLVYGRIYHTAGVVGALLIMLVAFYYVRRSVIRSTEDDPSDYIPAMIFGLGAVLVAPWLFFDNFGPMVQVWFAPRLYVAEWLAGLLK